MTLLGLRHLFLLLTSVDLCLCVCVCEGVRICVQRNNDVYVSVNIMREA